MRFTVFIVGRATDQNRKSQIAIEFCYRYQEQHPDRWIFWVYSATKSRFIQAYRDIANLVRIPSGGDSLHTVHDWLADAGNGRWLLIIDNADDDEVFFSSNNDSEVPLIENSGLPFCSFVPCSAQGDVLITSRNQTGAVLALYDESVESVQPFEPGLALQLLEKKVPNASKSADGVELVELLDAIPLAIAQAGSYIKKTRMTVFRYVQIFKESTEKQAELLAKPWIDLRRDPTVQNAIITTWKVSMEKIRAQSNAAWEILATLSLLSRQLIPTALIRLNGDGDLDYYEATAVLLDYSMLTYADEDNCYTMHRLVQLSTRTWLESNGQLVNFQRKAIERVYASFEHAESFNSSTAHALISHAIKVLMQYTVPPNAQWLKYEAESTVYFGLSLRVALLYFRRGGIETAELMLRQCLRVHDTVLGDGDHFSITALRMLAKIYWIQRQYDDAVLHYERLLNIIGEKSVDGSNDETISNEQAMYDLSSVFEEMRNHEEAKVLLTWPEAFRHANTRDESLNIQVHRLKMLRIDGRLQEADDLLPRVMDRIINEPSLVEATLCGDHGKHILREIGMLYKHRNELDKAESVLELAIRAPRDLDEGPDADLEVRYSLAEMYLEQERYKEAEETCMTARKMADDELGPSDPTTLKLAALLADLATRLKDEKSRVDNVAGNVSKTSLKYILS